MVVHGILNGLLWFTMVYCWFTMVPYGFIEMIMGQYWDIDGYTNVALCAYPLTIQKSYGTWSICTRFLMS